MITHRQAALLAALAAAVALGVALASERFGGLAPCALCLVERWPYRIAIGLGVLAALLPRAAGRVVLAMLALIILGDAAIAFVHVGVEQHLWPSPLPECAAPHLATGSVSKLLASMPLRPAKPCDSPSYLIPLLPLSMAAMDLIYALVFASLIGAYLWRTPWRAR